METINGQLDAALLFAQVVEDGSFTAAAERLGRSKAYVSKAIAALERRLGVQLLIRTTRRLNLTEVGRTYLAYCQQLRDTLEAAEGAVSASRAEVSGTLRITAATAFGDAFLPRLLGDFLQQHPRVDVVLDLSVDQRDLVDGGYDFAFRSARRIDDRLVARQLGWLREIPVAAPRLLQGRATPVEPTDLAGWPALFNSHLPDHQRWHFQRDGHGAHVDMQGRFAANLFSPLRRAALIGLGVALLPLHLVSDDLAKGRLLRLIPDYDMPPTPLHLVYVQRQHYPHRNRVFRDFVVQWFTDPARRADFA